MRFWKKRDDHAVRKGILQVALQGAVHEELAQEALSELVLSTGADRIGVWIEAPTQDGMTQEGAFQGVAWDRESEATPKEWRTLTPQAILPLPRLLSGLTVDANLAEDGSQPLVGPLAGLQNAVWVPVQHAGKLRGILLAGTFAANRTLRKQQLQSVATELTAALALETEHRLAGTRHADIALCNRILTSLQEKSEPEDLLRYVVESCVVQAGHAENPGASFAFIGRAMNSERGQKEEQLKLTVMVAAGDEMAQRFVRLGAVQELASRALKMNRTVGNEISPPSSGEASLRVIAAPLTTGDKEQTVLIAGFRAGQASLSSLERMELRGKLAASVLFALREREESTQQRERERAILDSSSGPIVLVGPQGEVAESNRGARMLLMSLSPALGEPGLDDAALPPRKQFPEYFRVKDREKVAAWQMSQKAEPKNGGESLEVELASGVRVRLRSDAAGGELQVIALLPMGNRVTEEENRARVELLNLTEWLDQGVILFDGQENVRVMNLRFAQLAGLAPAEVEKFKTLDSLIERLSGQSAEPKLFRRHWEELARRAEGGEREEVHLLRPAARVLERASRPVLDVSGKKIGRIELYRDLTAQRLFQAKLLQTERLAALGQMVSGVAHELSNPLTSILGYAQRLLLRSDAGGHYEEIRRIFAEAERAGAILRRMLLAARESAPERKAVPLNPIIQRTIELQRFSLAAERIRVDVQLEADLPQVVGDAGQLQQILMNLLGNARQAIEAQGHGGTICVRTQRTEDNRVRLEVSDSGPGIPEGIMARIFDPFFTTKPAGVGTGLGLSIVLSLVREHGGQVHVSSPRGSGAVFVVELPAAGQKETWEGGAPGAKSSPIFAPQERRSFANANKVDGAQRVLVVEDEPTVAQLISDVLRDEGFEIEILLDGRDAAERVLRESFDLIICDMKMPNLDGQSLYESLLPGRKFLQKRFLFVTGDVLGAKTQEFLTKNELPHLAKPFRMEELLEKVHQVLQPASSVGPRRATPLRKNRATTG